MFLAHRIAAKLGGVEEQDPPVIGRLDVTPWRDDMPRQDAPMPSPDARIKGATVVLVDDVLYTGRTVRAAIKPSPLRPLKRIQLPFWSTAATASSPSARTTSAKTCRPPRRKVCVRLREVDGADSV